MITKATHEDIPAIVALGAHFHAASGYATLVPYDLPSIAERVARMIDSDAAVVFTLRDDAQGIVGIAGAVSMPAYFNRNCRVAAELFWWVEPDHRRGSAPIRLMRAMEHWARDIGCVLLSMMSLEALDPVRVDRIYRAANYVPAERAYLKPCHSSPQ